VALAAKNIGRVPINSSVMKYKGSQANLKSGKIGTDCLATMCASDIYDNLF